MIGPRPILLVADPLGGDVRLHHHTEAVLNREGYLVLRCPTAAMDSFKVLAPHPFTAADVALLRAVHLSNAAFSESHAGLASIADRIEALL